MISGVTQWLDDNPQVLGWTLGISVLMFVLAASLLPLVINRMRADYFLDDRDHERSLESRHPFWHVLGMLGKNLLGVFLLLMGILMLIGPGQGLLTIFAGLILMDFPGKRQMEIRIMRVSLVNRAINWIREKGGKEPLQLPEKA